MQASRKHLGCTLALYLLSLYLISSQTADSLQGEELLRHYGAEWQRYEIRVHYMNRTVLSYLNRYWVKRERDEGKIRIFPVHKVRCIHRRL